MSSLVHNSGNAEQLYIKAEIVDLPAVLQFPKIGVCNVKKFPLCLVIMKIGGEIEDR